MHPKSSYQFSPCHPEASERPKDLQCIQADPSASPQGDRGLNYYQSSRVALITGASGGLGRALALAFAKEGYALALQYHHQAVAANRLVRRIIKAGGRAWAFGADVGDAWAVKNLIDGVRRRCNRLDVLVHAAGNIAPALLLRMDGASFDKVLRVHLKGAFLLTQAVALIMKKQKKGSIVYVGSIAGLRGVAAECNYAAAKAGLMGLAKSAAKELGRWGVRVNVVLPGYMMTAMGRQGSVRAIEGAKKENVLGHWTDPSDSARMILALAESPGLSGQVINIDGRIA